MSEIQLTSFIKDSASICTFAEDIIGIIGQDLIKEDILRPKIFTLRSILSEFDINVEKISEDKKKKLDEIVDGIVASVDDYSLIILNQSLQILCSLFESFLIRSLKTIFETKVETLIGLAEKKEIKLEEIIKAGNYQEIINSFSEKILKGFSGASTQDQFKKYYEKLGFDINRFFDMSKYKPKIQAKFNGWDLEKLISIFSERHAIVHEGALPLVTLNDLLIRYDFFYFLMQNISIEINNKFNIKNDLDLPKALQQI